MYFVPIWFVKPDRIHRLALDGANNIPAANTSLVIETCISDIRILGPGTWHVPTSAGYTPETNMVFTGAIIGWRKYS